MTTAARQLGLPTLPPAQRFDGSDLTPEDRHWLSGGLREVLELMRDGQWRTLREISEMTSVKGESVGAQLRNLRKPENGGYTVEKQHPKDGRTDALWEYRLLTHGFVNSHHDH